MNRIKRIKELKRDKYKMLAFLTSKVVSKDISHVAKKHLQWLARLEDSEKNIEIQECYLQYERM